MRIVANSEQKFNLWSRRLITMEKIASINDTATAESALEVSEKMPAHSGFRKKYFNKFEKPNEQ
jgi:tRNA (guanine10-N2)-methyltransferase